MQNTDYETDDESQQNEQPTLEIDPFHELSFSVHQRKQTEKQQAKELEKENKKAEKLQKIQEREQMKLFREVEKQAARDAKKDKKQILPCSFEIENENENSYTELQGRTKIFLQKKINQYRELFPILKSIKIKKNCSEQEMEAIIEEYIAVIEVNNVDQFIYDGILQSITVVEGISQYSRLYNITGLTQILKSNVQFENTCKLLFLKYGIYSKIEPEYQLLFILSTSIYIANQKNRQKEKIQEYLNQSI